MAVLRHATRPLWAGFLFRCNAPGSRFSTTARAIVLLVVLSFPLSTLAAVGVSASGLVIDTTGTPIQGVAVVCTETGTSAETDVNGHFYLADLPPGQYHLSFNRLGYTSKNIGPIAIIEGVVSQLQVRLASASVKLPQVDIYRRLPAGVETDGVVMTVRSRDWAQSGARTVGDALRLIPSVTIRDDGHSQRISLRGSRPRAVQVDLDGVPLNDPGTGEADVSSVPLVRLEAVEVEMLGDGGNVHLLSRAKDAISDFGNTGGLETVIGSHGQREGALHFARQSEIWGWNLQGGSSIDEGDFIYFLDDGTRLRRYNNGEQKQNIHAGMSWRRTKSKFETSAFFSEVNRGVPGLIYAAPTPEANYDTRRIAARLSYQQAFGAGGVEATAHALKEEGEFRSPARQFDPNIGDTVYNMPEWSRQSAERYGVSLSLQPPFTASALNISYKWQFDGFIGRDLFTGRVEVGGVGYGNAERQTHHLGLGAKRIWTWNPWNITLAPLLAGDYIEDTGLRSAAYFAPSVLLTARRPGKLMDASISLSRSRSVTQPPFNALFTVESMVAAGNRNLKPERGESLVLSAMLEPQIPDWDSQASVSLFHRETSDFIVWKRNAWGKYYPDNLGVAQFTGAEISGRIEPSERGVALWFNYIYNRSRNSTPGDVNNGNFIPLTPLHSGSSGLTINRKNTILTLQGRWIGLSYSSESNLDPISTAGMGLPAYSVYDVNVSQSIPFSSWKGTIEAGVNNLLDSSYRIVERSPMPGRSYWVRVSLKMQQRP